MESDILEQRKGWLNDYFFIDTKIQEIRGSYVVVKRKNYVGLVIDGIDILETLFDEIVFIDTEFIKARVADKWGLFDIVSEKWIIKPLCNIIKLHKFYNTIELIIGKKHGLISIPLHKIVVPIKYEDVSINANGEYIWVKEFNVYSFLKKSSGQLLRMQNASFAYDNEEYMMVLIDGKVYCMNELGNKDEALFRKLVIENKGRLRLMNYKYRVLDIVDIYGNIIN